MQFYLPCFILRITSIDMQIRTLAIRDIGHGDIGRRDIGRRDIGRYDLGTRFIEVKNMIGLLLTQ